MLTQASATRMEVDHVTTWTHTCSNARSSPQPKRQPAYVAYFRIKGKSPSGRSTTFSTHEVTLSGKRISEIDEFRAYKGYDEAAADYASLIQKRYPTALADRSDPEKIAEAVARQDYALKDECGSIVAIEKSSCFEIIVRERHTQDCGGTPETGPRLFNVRVRKQDGRLTSDVYDGATYQLVDHKPVQAK